MMTKKEFISQLKVLASKYADERIGDNNKLFASNQHLREERDSWEQKYHSAMTANKKLDEQSEGLQVEKQALLDVIFEWKNDNLSLTALNATLSEELQELKKEDQLLTKTVQNWQRNYTQALHDKDILTTEMEALKKELVAEKERRISQTSYADKYAVKVCELAEELAEKESSWRAAIAAAEERHEELDKDLKLCAENCNYVIKENNYLRGEVEQLEKKHEDLKKKSHGILATLEENLQKKQEIIEALTVWKEGAESVLDTLEEELKDAKDVIHTQENTIEWLDGRVKRLKAKKAKKEQND